MSARYKFSEGEEVAHKENLSLKLTVARILFKSIYLSPSDKSNDHKIDHAPVKKMIGIECHWWNGNDLRKAKFHSCELVPWSIVMQGDKNVKAFLNC